MSVTRSVCFACVYLSFTGISDSRAQNSANPEPAVANIPAASAFSDTDSTSKPEATQHKGNSRSAFRPVMPVEPASPFAEDENGKPLKVGIFPMFDKLPANSKCVIAIELQVKSGWHVNANPSHPDYLVPTTIELKTPQKIKLTKTKFPKHHALDVQGEDQPYHVYDGKAIVYALLEISEPASTEFAELEFHIRYQGCNSSTCLPPDLLVMKGKLPLAKEGEALKKINLEKFPKPKAKDGQADDQREKSLFPENSAGGR